MLQRFSKDGRLLQEYFEVDLGSAAPVVFFRSNPADPRPRFIARHSCGFASLTLGDDGWSYALWFDLKDGRRLIQSTGGGPRLRAVVIALRKHAELGGPYGLVCGLQWESDSDVPF